MAFDPYHKWLGIPPDQQPPNHYRLLSVPQFESDADVIDTAAEQRTLLLRTFQIGPEAALAERLLNEVAVFEIVQYTYSYAFTLTCDNLPGHVLGRPDHGLAC